MSSVILPTAQCTDIVCWTRMQAEAGQDIRSIIARKELERQAGSGLFFWGVGNAPNRRTKDFAAKASEIDVVFSLMKGRPREADSSPSSVVVWRTYFDTKGHEHELPSNVLITSRASTELTMKSTHYALMCWSDDQLQFGDFGPFDPSMYRNVGGTGGRVSHSQVTALVVKTEPTAQESAYRINMRARLTGSFWVKLGNPCLFEDDSRKLLARACERAPSMCNNDWLDMVSEFRGVTTCSKHRASQLF